MVDVTQEDREPGPCRHRIQAVEAERARVVAWLRVGAAEGREAFHATFLANAIERGDHLAGDGGTAPNAPPQE